MRLESGAVLQRAAFPGKITPAVEAASWFAERAVPTSRLFHMLTTTNFSLQRTGLEHEGGRHAHTFWVPALGPPESLAEA